MVAEVGSTTSRCEREGDRGGAVPRLAGSMRLRASRRRPSRRPGCTSRTRSFPSSDQSRWRNSLRPTSIASIATSLRSGRSRGPYAPATIRRVHGIIRRALTQGCPLGMDHPQSGDRRVAAEGSSEGVEAAGSCAGCPASSIKPLKQTRTWPRSSCWRPRPAHVEGSCWHSGGGILTWSAAVFQSSEALSGLAAASSNRGQRRIRVVGSRSMQSPLPT